MLGRADERAAVGRLLGEGRTALVTGPAGIGKTTLAGAVLDGHPHAGGGAVAGLRWYRYLPLRRALGERLDAHADDEPEAVAATVAIALAGRVLFVDDLHWADPGTQAVLEHLIDRVPVLVTSRSDEPRPGWADRAHEVRLGPLPRRSARRLARNLHPDLPPAQVERLVDAAEGSPLLLGALVAGGVAAPTLKAAIAERLRAATPATREAVALLALHGRPLAVDLLPPDADLHAGLVAVDGEHATLGHQAFGPAALEGVAPAAEATLHRRLAALLPPTEAAGHHLAVGDRAAAAAAASRALATTADTAERAHLLTLLAEATDDDEHRLEAAAALIKVGDLEGALELVGAVGAGHGAEAALLESQARWFGGDVDGAEAAIERGLALAGDDLVSTARLTVESAHQRIRGDRRPVPTVPQAEDALRLAEQAGVEVPRARLVLARAAVGDRRPDWEERFRDAIDQADRTEDGESACQGRFYLASHLGFAGRFADAIAVLSEGIERARELGERVWETHMTSARLTDRFMVGGDPGTIADEAAAFVAANPTFRNRAQPEIALALSLADLGRGTDAEHALERARATLRGDENHSILLAAATEVAWLTGDLAAAIERGHECAGLLPGWFGIAAGGVAAGAYARMEAGRTVDAEPPDGMIPVHASFRHEVEGLRHWSAGDLPAAIACFDRVTEDLATHIPARYVARAAWAAASAAAQAATDDADVRRRRAEELAVSVGVRPLQDRVRRIDRTDADQFALTPRQAQVLELAGQGLTSTAIAARLGIARSTVDSHIASARRRLGARTRRQAATLLDTDR